MNEPIINPWIIYFADLSEKFNIAFSVIGGFGIFICIVILFMSGVVDDKFSGREAKTLIRTSIKYITIFAVILTVGTFLPTKKTIYSMTILNNITPSNVENFKGNTLEIVDHIIDKINGIETEQLKE